MEIRVDVTAFRRSLTQPGVIHMKLDNDCTLRDVLARLVDDEKELASHLMDGAGRPAVYLVVDGTVVPDLAFRPQDGALVVVMPVIGGG